MAAAIAATAVMGAGIDAGAVGAAPRNDFGVGGGGYSRTRRRASFPRGATPAQKRSGLSSTIFDRR